MHDSGCHDGGYSTVLKNLQNRDILHKIVLLPGYHSIAREIRDLNRPALNIDNLFVTSKIEITASLPATYSKAAATRWASPTASEKRKSTDGDQVNIGHEGLNSPHSSPLEKNGPRAVPTGTVCPCCVLDDIGLGSHRVTGSAQLCAEYFFAPFIHSGILMTSP
jgi:hypothetical protein